MLVRHRRKSKIEKVTGSRDICWQQVGSTGSDRQRRNFRSGETSRVTKGDINRLHPVTTRAGAGSAHTNRPTIHCVRRTACGMPCSTVCGAARLAAPRFRPRRTVERSSTSHRVRRSALSLCSRVKSAPSCSVNRVPRAACRSPWPPHPWPPRWSAWPVSKIGGEVHRLRSSAESRPLGVALRRVFRR
jgi:hypothetical protein